MNETVHQETIPAAGEQQTERTFTQAEVNAIIADRLNRERAKYADYDDLKAKAQQFDTAQAQLDTLTKANAQRDMRTKVSAATGVPADLLTGDTEEACTTQAQAIMNFAKPAAYPSVKDGGDPYHVPSTPDVAAKAFARNQKHTPKPYQTY